MSKRMHKLDHEYFHKIMTTFERLAEPKFEAGTVEHNSHIWDLTDEELELAELEELIDMVMYRVTKILKRLDSEPRRY